jgi:hypothetical protein
MSAIYKTRQHGQAMTEFLIASLVLVPLFMGAVYLAKYSDIKHAAIQASRYASMDRAINPQSVKSNETIRQEAKVRFFTQQEARNAGVLNESDKSFNPDKEKSQIAYWRDLAGKRLIDNFGGVGSNSGSVRVEFRNSDLGAASKVQEYAGKLFGLPSEGMYAADVEVSLLNIGHFEPLSKIDLKIGATTVFTGNAWNAGGNKDVEDHLTKPSDSPLKPAVAALKLIATPLDWVFGFFENSGGPKLWCINANVVPNSRLQTYQAYPLCSY